MKNFIIMASVATAIVLTGCEKDRGPAVNGQVQQTMQNMYPDASNVSWKQSGSYTVAEFASSGQSGQDSRAWFDNGGKWYMTETDIHFDALPEAVKTSFSAGEYAGWRTDDVDRLERNGEPVVYVIEAESRESGTETEVELYYFEDGTLIRESIDTDEDDDYSGFIPSDPSASPLEDFIRSRYEGAIILERDYEDGMTEIEIYHDSREKDVLFDRSGNWTRTSWEVRTDMLPEAVKATIASEYAGYRADDAEYAETPSGDFYVIELEGGGRDMTVSIGADGSLQAQG